MPILSTVQGFIRWIKLSILRAAVPRPLSEAHHYIKLYRLLTDHVGSLRSYQTLASYSHDVNVICDHTVPPDYKRWIQIPIEDAGDGTYNFCYTPEVEGKYHIAVRVGAEYTSKYAIVWEITNWSLGQKVPQFTAGKYSWKVKLQKEAGETQIGVTAKRQFWVWKSGEKLEGTPFHAKSAISEWKAGDEFVVFLDCECERLTVVNTRNGQCDVWNGLRQGVYSPYCYPTDNVSLDI